ncbi:MAG: hypothetical protein PVF83_10640 [Anaerolineales bacterium]|jgi:hypothetical protein
MRTELHSLLTDIKAAARIGHAESLWMAMDGLFDLPEVAGNPPLKPTFIRQAILPIGETLATRRITAPMLHPLAHHDHAAIRAIAAAAYANRFFNDIQNEESVLDALGQDPRKDVRQALIFGVIQAGEGKPDKLAVLIERWIEEDSLRLQSVALRLLPSLAEVNPDTGMKLLSEFQPSNFPEVRASLVECLVELAQREITEEILSLLQNWVAESGNNLWVISKTFSRSWAVHHTDSILEILTLAAKQHGPEKAILKALKAMSRHGAEQAIEKAVERWEQDSNPNLQTLAEQVTQKPKK